MEVNRYLRRGLPEELLHSKARTRDQLVKKPSELPLDQPTLLMSIDENNTRPLKRVTGYLYDKEALKQLEAKGLTRHAWEDLSCIGTRKFYKGDMYGKFREELEAAESEIGTIKGVIVPFEIEGQHATLSSNGAISETTSGSKELDKNH
ncbi:hypothetical protein RIF29_12160 [Crotalaria pallida]|uniref:Uncharacterized protein n=1 Tax=Crotalaria pallida TaxID=3830 RepID=A0AAN9IMZ3_CROPI